jgi:NAD(P)-dependent dehydrogenase (short-subunit alcohol dehydrogenase family)
MGASSGLGRAVALGLAHEGAHLALAARREEMVQAAADEAGNGAVALVCDVSDGASCERAVSDAVAALGGLDALLYTAAVGTLARLERTDEQAWDEGFRTNVTGAALVTRAALPHLDASHGKAIYFSSMNGGYTAPWPGLGMYGVTKAALERMVESWQMEHPRIAFTRLIIGPAAGDAAAPSEFGRTWDGDLVTEIFPTWSELDRLGGNLLTSEDLSAAVVTILEVDAAMPLVAIIPRA